MGNSLNFIGLRDSGTRGYDNQEVTPEFSYLGHYNDLFVLNKKHTGYIGERVKYTIRDPRVVVEPLGVSEIHADNEYLTKNFSVLWQFDIYKTGTYNPERPWDNVLYNFGRYQVRDMFLNNESGGAFRHTTDDGVHLYNGWSSRADIWNNLSGIQLTPCVVYTTDYSHTGMAVYIPMERMQEYIKTYRKYGFKENSSSIVRTAI